MSIVNALIVDDSSTIRKIIKTNLARFQITNCDEAFDGNEAWKLLHINKYDIIFTDYNMPGMNGLDLVKKIYASGDKYAQTKIVAISSEFNEELKAQFQNLGVKDFIAKPFSLEMFKKAVAPVLSNDNTSNDNTSLSLSDLSKLFDGQTPKVVFDGQYLVLDFGNEKLTIDAKVIAQSATLYAETEGN